jgi:hypothetical protein
MPGTVPSLRLQKVNQKGYRTVRTYLYFFGKKLASLYVGIHRNVNSYEYTGILPHQHSSPSLPSRRMKRLIEDNVKCRHLKKLTCKGAFAAGVYLSDPLPPTTYTLYMCIQYIYSHREGGGGEI